MIVVQTPRLILRHFTWNDVNDVAAIRADPVVMKFRNGSRTYEDTKQLFEWIFDNSSTPGFEVWAIIHKADNKLIGNCGLIPQVVEGRQETEMGYILAKEYWGRGLATEAACACRNYGFKQLGLSRLIALIDPGNIASVKVAKRVGLTYEKNAKFEERIVWVYCMHKPKIS